MKVKTTTEHFQTSPEALFAFLSQIENLPKWATGYCTAVTKEGDDYKIMTPEGPMYEAFQCDAATGVIDMFCGPTKQQLWCWPARITSDNLGGSVLALTAIQMPDQPDEVFDSQCGQLKEEFENIRRFVE